MRAAEPTTGSVGLADLLGLLMPGIEALPPFDLELVEAHGGVLAEDVVAPAPVPPFAAAAVDGYALRSADLSGARIDAPVFLSVIGDVPAAAWRPARITPGACYSVAAGAVMPAGADAVLPAGWTGESMVSVQVGTALRPGDFVRGIGSDVAEGEIVAPAGGYVSPAVVGLVAAAGLAHVTVRPRPRVVVVATGEELVPTGRTGSPGQVVDANSHALTAAAEESGAQAYRAGVVADEPEALRELLEDQTLRADLVVITGGTGRGPGDMVRRSLGRQGITFADVRIHPGGIVGYGTIGPGRTPVLCLPGDPGSAFVAFEAVVRPVLQKLAGASPVFRPSVKGNLSEAVTSPPEVREFRPVQVSERRGGGYGVVPLPGGPHLLSGLARANGLMVLGERVAAANAGTTVDVLMFDRRR